MTEFKYPYDTRSFATLEDAQANGYSQLVEIVMMDITDQVVNNVPDPHASYQGAPTLSVMHTVVLRRPLFVMARSNDESIATLEGELVSVRLACREFEAQLLTARDDHRKAIEALQERIKYLEKNEESAKSRIEKLEGEVQSARDKQKQAEQDKHHAEQEVARLARRVMDRKLDETD